ncbi:MAG TPA: hypothetical protein PKE04_10465, partial [Clostridia bacterium]|nr:hypothetical protein [Clostridia bacterium]
MTLLATSASMLPRWFTLHLGTDFGERFHTDPVYRYGELLAMKRALCERFADVPEFQHAVNAGGAEEGCATISGVYGIKLVARLYGQPILYRNDDWPEGAPHFRLTPAEIARMDPIDLDAHPVMAELEEQMDVLEAAYGIVEGYVNYQGILNTAFALCGSDIFLTLLEDEACADAVFAHIADTMLRLAKRIQARQRRGGFDLDLLSVSNCVMNMISPQHYERFVLPHDRRLSESFARFGMHTCNWNVTPYLDSIRKIEKIGYLDMGIHSDMARAQSLFPYARRAVLYTPLWVENKTEAEISADISKIHAELGACDIVLADLSDTTTDDQIRAFLRLVDKEAK